MCNSYKGKPESTQNTNSDTNTDHNCADNGGKGGRTQFKEYPQVQEQFSRTSWKSPKSPFPFIIIYSCTCQEVEGHLSSGLWTMANEYPFQSRIYTGLRHRHETRPSDLQRAIMAPELWLPCASAHWWVDIGCNNSLCGAAK
ncbi:hypothetical protein NPIL_423801 [Nephila pilipes]|uniref:Uncharacterized protein n=1 Tax=Nephila pilipes TaxID=299642 RepID=A0A8X6TW49_NEPPI|nr:hypothetical protein NPIL_423801 [Nephila pilipes]